ncbi:MAG: efflux RND transporter periplasmic adaptor subunit [Prevotellaceae bacterium]|jgi:RND family efflux transporter MFP subunit|nr:efflux RND transporter periplasmic adaptor subunit [Prevotellaceae bacterium]
MINKLTVSVFSFALVFTSCKQAAQTAETSEREHSKEIVISDAQMKAVGIEFGQVEMRDLNSVVRVNGQLTLDPQKRAEVTSLTSGIVRQLLVTEGTKVAAGQTVAYLENTEIVELQKNYLVQKKETLVAEQEYNRQKELAAQGAGVGKNLQQSAANCEISKAQLTALEKQLRQLTISPERIATGNLVTQIALRSPIAGFIDKMNVSTGSYLNMQTPLMTIVDNSQMHCDLRIFEKDLPLVRVGQNVDIMLTNQPGISLKAVIYNINKSFENETKTIIVHSKITDKRRAELIPGMYVTALINTGKQKTQSVPVDAIVSIEGKNYIYAVENDSTQATSQNEFHLQQIEVITGVSELGYTQITPVGHLPATAAIIKSNAFYIASMSVEHSEH